MFRPSKKPRERVQQILDLLEEYRSAPSRQVARAAIEQLLIERELPWLLKQLGRPRAEPAEAPAAHPGEGGAAR
jgi:hypothetical protein